MKSFFKGKIYVFLFKSLPLLCVHDTKKYVIIQLGVIQFAIILFLVSNRHTHHYYQNLVSYCEVHKHIDTLENTDLLRHRPRTRRGKDPFHHHPRPHYIGKHNVPHNIKGVPQNI